MTEIRWERSPKKNRLRLQGHAVGSEKVCAGVSAIAFSLLGYLENLGDKDPEIDGSIVSDGLMVVSTGRSERKDAAFDMALVGLLQIQQAEPGYIRIFRREW